MEKRMLRALQPAAFQFNRAKIQNAREVFRLGPAALEQRQEA